MEQDDDVDGIPKLGIIAACQLDGSVSFYAVPHPKDIRQQSGAPEGQTIYCKASFVDKGHTATFDMDTNDGRAGCQTSPTSRAARFHVQLYRLGQWRQAHLRYLDR
jgi:hypothetical protein